MINTTLFHLVTDDFSFIIDVEDIHVDVDA